MRIRSRKQIARLVLISLIGFALLLIFRLPQVQKIIISAQPGQWRVLSVDDGDTIVAQDPMGHEETIRFIGVDTPEVKDPRKPVQCFGETASKYTKSIITIGSYVRLAPDPLDSDRDKYNRLLRYVYLPDGTLYNAQLIREGYGFAYIVFPYTQKLDFITLEIEAQKNNRGLWATCGVDSSTIIKQTTYR